MKSSAIIFCSATLALIALIIGIRPNALAADQQPKLRQFIYLVRLAPRLYEEKGWTPQDRDVVMRHFDRLKKAAEKGPVIFAGRTDEPNSKTFGIVVFEAPTTDEAKAFMESDPAVKAGLMTAELHPYMVAVLRSP
jgi:uncharacterized protein